LSNSLEQPPEVVEQDPLPTDTEVTKTAAQCTTINVKQHQHWPLSLHTAKIVCCKPFDMLKDWRIYPNIMHNNWLIAYVPSMDTPTVLILQCSAVCTVQPHGGSRAITIKKGNAHTSTAAHSSLKPTISRRYTHRPHGGRHLKQHKTIISMNSAILFPPGHKGRNSFLPLILASGYIWNLLSFETSEKRTLTANAKNVNMNFKVTFPVKNQEYSPTVNYYY